MSYLLQTIQHQTIHKGIYKMTYSYNGIHVKFLNDFCLNYAYYGQGFSFETMNKESLISHLAADLGCPYEIAKNTVDDHYGCLV